MAFFLSLSSSLFAQEILIQWTGVVRTESLEPISHVHIIAQRDFRPAVSDLDGVFTIITYPSDTLFVSSIGFVPLKIPVPAFTTEDSRHYYKDIILEEDVVMLRDLVILPWRTYREFREAVLALDLPEDDLIRAYRNINILQTHISNAIANRQASPNANFREFNNSRVTRMMNYGHIVPIYSITNPIAWAQFFRALQNGEFRRRDDDGGSENSPSTVDVIRNENSER